MTLPRCVQQILQIIEQRRRSVHRADLALNFEQGGGAEDRFQFLEHFAPIHSEQHGALAGPIRHTQFNAHEKTIELRFGQRKCSHLMLGILRSDNKEWAGQFVRHAVS